MLQYFALFGILSRNLILGLRFYFHISSEKIRLSPIMTKTDGIIVEKSFGNFVKNRIMFYPTIFFAPEISQLVLLYLHFLILMYSRL